MKTKQSRFLLGASFVLNVFLLYYIFVKPDSTSLNKHTVSKLEISEEIIPSLQSTQSSTKSDFLMGLKTHNSLKKESPHFLPKHGVFNWDGTSWKENKTVCDHLPSFREATLRTRSGNTPIFIHNPSVDKWISQSLLVSGVWEADVAGAVVAALKADSDLAFLDIGANIGAVSLEVAKLGRRVVSIEPLIDNVQRLCLSFQKGHFPNNSTIVFNAVSDDHEKVSLGRDQDNVGGTFVLNNNPNKINGTDVDLVGEYNEPVHTILLDDLLTLLLPNPLKKVVIKLDVEGYEDHVLKGANLFFEKVDVHCVIMEWTYSKNIGTAEVIQSFMSKHNMLPHDLSHRNLEFVPRQRWPKDVMWLKTTT